MAMFSYRHLYAIGSITGVRAVIFRVSMAVGIVLIGGVLLGHPAAGVVGGASALFITLSDIGTTPRVRLGTMFAGWLAIIAGGTLGHELGGTPNGAEVVVVFSALVAGWASASHPGIAAVTRFFAVAAAAGTAMRFGDPDILLALIASGVCAFGAALCAWKIFGIPTSENVMDWRAGIQRAFVGAGAGPRFAICYAAAAAVALFAASYLHVRSPYWATLVVLMVMRREGTVSFELNIQYAIGTILGVIVADILLRFVDMPIALAIAATLIAAMARVGFSVNPSLGYMAFTMFLLVLMHLLPAGNATPSLLGTRLYDVGLGCLLALAGTLAATFPRTQPSTA